MIRLLLISIFITLTISATLDKVVEDSEKSQVDITTVVSVQDETVDDVDPNTVTGAPTEIKSDQLVNKGLFPTAGPSFAIIRNVSRNVTPAPSTGPPVATTPHPKYDIEKDTKIFVENGQQAPYIRGHTKIPCYCGVPNSQKKPNYSETDPTLTQKIVGGEAAYIREYPWTVGILRKGFFGFGTSKTPFCGGTLINDRYVLTASHCVDGQLPQGLQILVNDEMLKIRIGKETLDVTNIDGNNYLQSTHYNDVLNVFVRQDLLSSDEAKTIKVDVEKIMMHADYDRRTINNDIALIKLAQPIDMIGEGVITRPACLPASNTNDFTGLNATTAGWGTVSQGGSQSKILLKVDVPVISNTVCNGPDTKYQGKITDNMICAGFLETGGKDACQGDSGGPLTIENGGRRTLIGVVSWGYGCAQPMAPGVYTRVAKYPDWILTHTQDALWCA